MSKKKKPAIKSHLKERIIKSGYKTVTEFAEAIGVKYPRTLHKIANNQCTRLPLDLAATICVKLDCDMDDLFSVVK